VLILDITPDSLHERFVLGRVEGLLSSLTCRILSDDIVSTIRLLEYNSVLTRSEPTGQLSQCNDGRRSAQLKQ
jgi:hypothetical protein